MKVDLVAIQLSERFSKLDKDTQIIVTSLLKNERTVVAKDQPDHALALSNVLNRVEQIMDDQKRIVNDITQIKLRLEKDNANHLTRKQRIGREALQEQLAAKFHEETHIQDEETKIRRAIEDKILKALKFETMTERQEAIEAAHARAFEWVFEKDEQRGGRPWSNFSRWLEEGSGIYWINGKAASGKSTLMRFIYENRRTHDLLKIWAGSEPVRTGVFYFWNSGTTQQRSQSGLLRALLYEVLQQQRALIPVIFPLIWLLNIQP
jgi:hypothetical protein